ncbi:MAG TPA: single-stranded-DNA-specific exonuclease RecJ [Firmicutes bacterium]|nr:single-stranded-DNA-specific exonuclease RecJ [Bacillota bacterium]
MKRKQWKIARPAPGQVEQLQAVPGVSGLAALVLAARGIVGQQAAAFLDTAPHLADPFLLADMDRAVREIRRALEAGEKIAVYGDYDVDGVTATTVLIQYLRRQGAPCEYYIPDRISEGYGLNREAIRRLHEKGCRLMITVDSGITAVEEAQYAARLGMRLIVTDHHECQGQLPKAAAVVNPRRPDSAYPFRELAGVGVAFQLVRALEQDQPLEALLDAYGDIVAVGTVADVMPLVGENRAIVAYGLKRLEQTENQGLRMLMQKVGIQGPVSSNSVSFSMAPRINAAGRMGAAGQAVELFLTKDPDQAAALAEWLCQLNRRRQQEENNIYQQIMEQLDSTFDPARQKAIVLWGENWHNGVIGIVASRLADRYGVPTVLISMDGEKGKGSGRSVPGFNLYEALEHCAGCLERCGGHELAVGLTICRDQLEIFRRQFEEYAARQMQQGGAAPLLAVDAQVEPGALTVPAVRSLEVLEPFGMGNPQPVFCLRGLRLEEITPISSDRHIKMLLSGAGQNFYAFLFGMASGSCPFVCGDEVDAAFAAEINSYRGRESVQLVLKDLAWSEQEDRRDQAMDQVYGAFCRGEAIEPRQALAITPTRDDLVAVFRHVKAHAQQGRLVCPPRTLYRRIRYEAMKGMNLGKLLICLDIFQEFDIFACRPWDGSLEITVLQRQGKADINGSRILKQLLLQSSRE